MSKKALLIVGIIILAIGGGVAYLLSSNSQQTEMQDMRTEKTQSDEATDLPAEVSPEALAEQPAPAPGVYVDYSSSVIANTEGTKVLFFHAPWCPQCRALEADIKKQGLPGGVTVIKVDYDTNQALRQKYGVTLQTTLVRVDDQGNSVKKLVAYDNPSIESVKQVLQ